MCDNCSCSSVTVDLDEVETRADMIIDYIKALREHKLEKAIQEEMKLDRSWFFGLLGKKPAKTNVEALSRLMKRDEDIFFSHYDYIMNEFRNSFERAKSFLKICDNTKILTINLSVDDYNFLFNDRWTTDPTEEE